MQNNISIQHMQQTYDDMLLTQEQIDEIAERISRKTSERIAKELEKALKLKGKRNNSAGYAANTIVEPA